MEFWDLIQSSDLFFLCVCVCCFCFLGKAGEFQNAEMIQEPKSCSKSGCLLLAILLAPREIHSFNPLTMNQCFVLVLAGAAASAVATVTVAGRLCVRRMEDLF